MALFFLPTNVRIPTLLDDVRADYLAGRIDVIEFEEQVAHLLASGTANDTAAHHGLATVGEWR